MYVINAIVYNLKYNLVPIILGIHQTILVKLSVKDANVIISGSFNMVGKCIIGSYYPIYSKLDMCFVIYDTIRFLSKMLEY